MRVVPPPEPTKITSKIRLLDGNWLYDDEIVKEELRRGKEILVERTPRFDLLDMTEYVMTFKEIEGTKDG